MSLLTRPFRSFTALPTTLARWARPNSTSAAPTDVDPTEDESWSLFDDIPEAQYAATTVHGRSLVPAYTHPRPHGVPIALLHLRAHHHTIVDAFAYFAMHAAAALAIPVSRPAYLPTQRRLWTVPKGPFVHKKSQENFERRVHKRVIKAWDADGDVVRRWVEFLSEHSMPGVGMRVVQWERLPVGFGAKALANKDRKLLASGERIKNLGQKIVQAELAAPARGNETPVKV